MFAISRSALVYLPQLDCRMEKKLASRTQEI
ncbi:MAG: hypothetical protein RL660_1416 [Bacteroidota bacterium]